MPTIVNSSDFKDELFIPNASIVPDIQVSTPSNQDKLSRFIEKYERLLLVNALGMDQYNLLMTNIDQESGKWHDLIEGKTYDGKRFDGLKNIIVYYVYVNFLKYEEAQFSTTGLDRSNAMNATSVDPVYRKVDLWNMFVEMYQLYECGCLSSFIFLDFFFGEYKTSFVSLYQFLQDNSNDYDCSYFKFYRVQNILGI